MSNSVRQQGLTLVELLAAMAIAVVVAAAILALYSGITRTLSSQSAWRMSAVPAANAIELLAADLNSAFDPALGGIAAFMLEPDFSSGTGGCFLAFYTAQPSAGAAAGKIYDEFSVRYAAEKNGDLWTLVRESKPLFREGAEYTYETAAKGITHFSVSLFDGTAWTNRWIASQKGLPQAARLEISTSAPAQKDSNRLTAEVIIPAGMTVPQP